MIIFYSPDIEKDQTLPEVESSHCCRVLRMKTGDMIHVTDGKGNAFECEITNDNPRKTQIRIISKKEEPRHWKPKIRLAVAPTKNIDRMEWLLEKATEIGVDSIVFLKCARSERKEIKAERLEKILVSAMKQSMKSTLPCFVGMIDYNQFINSFMNNGVPGQRIMGYCSPEFPKKRLVDIYVPGGDITLMIGPEGDFSPQEVALAVNAGFIPSTFGNTRLRTETAALYALTTIHIMNNLSV